MSRSSGHILGMHSALKSQMTCLNTTLRSGDGIMLFTSTAQFPLHPICVTLLPPLPQAVHQINQGKQVLDPEQGAPSRPHQEWVRRRETRPTQGQDSSSIIRLTPIVNSIPIPASTQLNDLEALAVLRMERMRNREIATHFPCARRSRCAVPRPDA
jgi:hypothetical protein